jgi:hypothetical protein
MLESSNPSNFLRFSRAEREGPAAETAMAAKEWSGA